jgi:hypothetical protein
MGVDVAGLRMYADGVFTQISADSQEAGTPLFFTETPDGKM